MTRKELQAAIRREQRNPKGKAVRYPSEVREAVAAFVRAERSRGVTFGALATGLALPVNTLRRWSERHSVRPRLAPVEVVAETPAPVPVLVTPSGHRVEGLTVAALGDLLERLR